MTVRTDNERVSAFFNYLANGGDDVAKLRAECDYALGCLGHEISENEKLRAELQSEQAKCAVLGEALKPFADKAEKMPVATSDERKYTLIEVEHCRAAKAALSTLPASASAMLEVVARGNGNPVRFYEREFYPLSNFSAFNLIWKDIRFDTSEAAYHWEKFKGDDTIRIRSLIRRAPSAHEAFKIAEANAHLRRPDWSVVRVDIMRGILRAKADQHEYVRRKLLETGDRELVEDSWRDDFWGWGPNHDGQNMLGKLWMEVRTDLLALSALRSQRNLGKEDSDEI